MEKVSAKMFFTVLWRGVCQALGWFFGLFGYKRDGKFAKCVWGLFATSFAIMAAIVAFVLIMSFYEELGRRYGWVHECSGASCYKAQYLSGNIYYHTGNGRKAGYVFNVETGRKLIDDVDWIAEPKGNDSLVCFSNGERRGYFNMHTAEVVVSPKYTHAWVFSDGLAAVEEKGIVKFIDGTGAVKIDLKLPYDPSDDGYVFHDGHCAVHSHNGTRYGIVDTTGRLVEPMVYDYIKDCNCDELWLLRKGDITSVLDRELQPVLTVTGGTVFVGDGTIDVTTPEHTIRKYDMKGRLINDFYITDYQTLVYEKDEIRYCTRNSSGDAESPEPYVETYRPQAIARLRAYTAGDYYMGLMTAEGHVVTQPLYRDIQAIAQDLYICTDAGYEKVIVNGKGEIVK